MMDVLLFIIYIVFKIKSCSSNLKILIESQSRHYKIILNRCWFDYLVTWSFLQPKTRKSISNTHTHSPRKCSQRNLPWTVQVRKEETMSLSHQWTLWRLDSHSGENGLFKYRLMWAWYLSFVSLISFFSSSREYYSPLTKEGPIFCDVSKRKRAFKI